MYMSRFVAPAASLLVSAAALGQAPAPFSPDPATVQRYGAGYRYPQEGWIVLHIEGAPYERGVQHGRLLAPEIDRYMRCYATMQSPGAPTEGWKLMRTIVSTSFLRGFDHEYLEEMKGIADGASGAGVRFDDRPLDLIDVAALNLWAELMTLDDANAATPTGLEGIEFPEHAPAPAKPARDGHCSAFAATGKATKDGHAIIGHITMFGLYPSGFFNVWLDVKPEKGHRVMMQSYPAGIYSGMDYYLNDAGVAMVETTIDQTRFDIAGQPLASRARKALQYSDSIDGVVAALKEGNNGLYNNEWLLADMKTDEIAMYELGTKAGKLWRSSKNEWWGGTPGFYWGCNNTKDLGVRMETIPAPNDRPANMVWHPEDRDLKWVELYKANVGKMDEQFAKTAFTTPPLCSAEAVDVKFTTGTLAKNLQSWAIFGPPLGKTWMPTNEEIKKYKDIRPLVSNPWTVLGPAAGVPEDSGPQPVDLSDPFADHIIATIDEDKDKDDEPPTKPAWHGTILPASDGDIWLASAFAEYEEMVSAERGYAAAQPSRCLCADDYDKVASSLFAARSRYFAGVRKGGDVALSQVHPDTGTDSWFKIASGKGVLVLAELRGELGDEKFLGMMDAFGRAHAGASASTADFAAAASKAAGRDLSSFFKYWTTKTGLPRIAVGPVRVEPNGNSSAEQEPGWVTIKGVLTSTGVLPSSIEMTVESDKDELTQTVAISDKGEFEFKAKAPATRLIVDKYGRAARANGGEAEFGAFTGDLPHTIIVYGTADDAAANHEAAEAYQKHLRTSWANVEVPIVSDAKASDEDLKTHHLILIGRPHANLVTRRMAAALPVSFGADSFSVRADTYANCMSAVLAAGVNPMNTHLSINVIAGNSGAATLAHASEKTGKAGHGPEVLICDASGKTTSLVSPAPDLTITLHQPKSADAQQGK
jgi:hypothetical protein